MVMATLASLQEDWPSRQLRALLDSSMPYAQERGELAHLESFDDPHFFVGMWLISLNRLRF
jgi:hypothetical protein